MVKAQEALVTQHTKDLVLTSGMTKGCLKNECALS